MPSVATAPHQQRAREVRRLMSAYVKGEDLIRVGAYKPGADPELDRAIAMRARFRSMLEQTPLEASSLDDAIARLMSLQEMA